MTSDKKNVQLLAGLFVKKGLKDIIISPGSRNAPIVIAFAGNPQVNTLSIVDERSAAFFALGMAQQTGKTVAVACTSGSAALNYAPAIAEAYYRKVPLLVLTADRPPELIDRGYGQTIRQKDVYRNYIKAGFELPVEIENEKTAREAVQIIHEAIDLTQYPEPGPVHINIPFREPLYGTAIEVPDVEFQQAETGQSGTIESLDEMIAAWNRYQKVMIVAGQQKRIPALNKVLNEFVEQKNTVLLSETTSNLHGTHFIDCIDNVVSTLTEDEFHAFQPDLLVTFGGQVVSKMVKKYLRDNPPKEHWHVSMAGEKMDTFFRLKKTIKTSPERLFNELMTQVNKSSESYFNRWQERKKNVIEKREKYLGKIPYTDLKVFDFILSALPGRINLHLGNSTPVRYSQLFGSDRRFDYFSNRGVSGIDGQVSTAAGTAFVSNKLNVLITGDLGFFYDSNGLMNKYLNSDLKIIVINNGGGGIFRFIEGPSETEFLEDFFEARHGWKTDKIAEAFGLSYFRSENDEEFKNEFKKWLAENKAPALLEVCTPAETNGDVLRAYFRYLKEK